MLVLRPLGLTGEGRTGEEDSAPDWKILLSSQPLSSPHCETRLVLASDCTKGRQRTVR